MLKNKSKKRPEHDENWYLKRTIIFSYISIVISIAAIAITLIKKLL